MKKNVMMRVASALLVAVLLSTCAISGTFAKYVTEATGSDQARVAKWGVVITTTTSGLFAETYKNDAAIGSTAAGAGLSVDSEDGKFVVAPGTKGSVNFSISGTPEVAVDVKIVMNVEKDVIIPSGTVIAAGNTLSGDYTPVVFTLKDSADNVIATGTLSDIETGLEGLSAQYAPNYTLDETYTLSWAWAIDGVNDVADTYLGNVAAGTVTDTDTITDIKFDFTITATQID